MFLGPLFVFGVLIKWSKIAVEQIWIDTMTNFDCFVMTNLDVRKCLLVKNSYITKKYQVIVGKIAI